MRSSHLHFTEAWGDEDDVSFTATTLGVMVASSVVGLMAWHGKRPQDQPVRPQVLATTSTSQMKMLSQGLEVEQHLNPYESQVLRCFDSGLSDKTMGLLVCLHGIDSSETAGLFLLLATKRHSCDRLGLNLRSQVLISHWVVFSWSQSKNHSHLFKFDSDKTYIIVTQKTPYLICFNNPLSSKFTLLDSPASQVTRQHGEASFRLSSSPGP